MIEGKRTGQMKEMPVYDGKTLPEWAAELGLSAAAMRIRVACCGSLEGAVRIGANKRLRQIYEGKNTRAWAAELGISRQAMYMRIHEYGSLEGAVRAGKRRRARHLYRGKGIAEWAVELGMSVGYVRQRMMMMMIAGSLEGAVELCRMAQREGRFFKRKRLQPPKGVDFTRGTLKEAADRCGVSPPTIRMWRLALGSGPSAKASGNG